MKPDKFNILIVDDSLLSLNHLKHILLKEGYEVKAVDSGEKAVASLEGYNPDLILLDIMMPGMDGFQVIEALRDIKSARAIPVIFLTGNDDHESKIKAFDLGAVDYIVKPFHPHEVKARVKVHLKLGVATKSIIESQTKRLEQVKQASKSILIEPDSLPGASFAVYYNTLLEAGGDFYDVLKISEDVYSYFVADVSGHDIATSYINPAVKALLRQNSSPIYSEEETIGMMNQVLIQTLPPDKYLSAFYLKLNRKRKRLRFINAAHPPAIYIPVKGEARFIDNDGDLIGMFEDAYYPATELEVEKGDRFVLYTDGLVETTEESAVWTNGCQRLLPVVESLRDVPLSDFPHFLFDKMVRSDSSVDDDIIVFVLEV